MRDKKNMLFLANALIHMSNHDGKFCLTQRADEPFADFYIHETIHFLFYHRWWEEEEIQNSILKEPHLNRQELIRTALSRPFKCHPTLHKLFHRQKSC